MSEGQSSVLPTSLFENLLVKLTAVLELTQSSEGTSTPQAKQAVYQATTEFKASLAKAKELAEALPGGQMLIEEQDEVIDMLLRLKQRKCDQLAEFSRKTMRPVDVDMDSTASTPASQG